MGTLHAWRKAYGAIKDSTKSTKDVDVAIVKATNHVECPPKGRHLRKILVATSAIQPRADVAYCIHSLSRRLEKTHNWMVALKTLMVIHRILREGDPIFREELLYSQQRGHILEMSNFRDDSSPIAWDCSAWVRTYALYLEERLECFRILKYDIESKRLPRPAQGEDEVYSRTRDLNSEELLEQLSALQQQLHRLIGCQPEGAALGNYVIQYALALVLKESFKIYCAINDGIITLVDKFFEMPRHEAIKGLDIYKRAGQLAGSLSGFYEVCKGLELDRNFQFPVLREPPQSFLVTMEEYTREAPQMVSVPIMSLEYPEMLQLTCKHEDVPSPSEETKVPHEEPKPPCSEDVVVSIAEAVGPLPLPTNLDTDDLLGLNVTAPDASAIEESNAMALAMVPSGTTYGSDASQAKDFDPTGWEVALVSTLSSNLSSFQERQLAGGLDSLTLHSLYDDAAYRASQQPAYGALSPNPFEVADPFAIANTVASPPAVQMAQNQTAQNQTNPFAPFQPIYPQPQQQQQQQHHLLMSPKNPFGDTGFGEFTVNPAAHPQTSNPFGSTGLL